MYVRYGKTFSLGNYQTEHIELEVSNVEKDHYELVLKWLVQRVEALHKISMELQKQKEDNLTAEHNKTMDPAWLGPEL